jgi:hypothetical protein
MAKIKPPLHEFLEKVSRLPQARQKQLAASDKRLRQNLQLYKAQKAGMPLKDFKKLLVAMQRERTPTKTLPGPLNNQGADL